MRGGDQFAIKNDVFRELVKQPCRIPASIDHQDNPAQVIGGLREKLYLICDRRDRLLLPPFARHRCAGQQIDLQYPLLDGPEKNPANDFNVSIQRSSVSLRPYFVCLAVNSSWRVLR